MKDGLFFLIAYGMGSLPFGVILVRLFGEGNLRQLGSGNIGATNVVRTQGKKWLGTCVFLLDAGKGALACASIAPFLESPSLLPWIGCIAVAGHCFSCFLKGRGGKGVSTALGVFLLLTPPVGASCLLLWGGVFWVSKTSSLASLVSVGAAPVFLWAFTSPEGNLFWAYVCMVLLVFCKHHRNIQRLLRGEERSFRGGDHGAD